ncbi:MAG: undecaprenyl-phosphate glucose phosphotransferase [Pseudomonadota bacterium]|nr:undecaprenyl-phosphate glucose phosphotransferase [Pseudomonadota bacterium]
MLPDSSSTAAAYLGTARRAVPRTGGLPPIGVLPPGRSSLLRVFIDAAAAPAALLVCARWFDVQLTAAHAILVLLAVALTLAFRSPVPAASAGSSPGAVMLRWMLVCAILYALGSATGTLAQFNPALLLSWALAAPVLQVVAHRAVPRLLGRWAADAGRRTAVIAGVNPTGCMLANHINGDPLLSTQVSGYFDDRDCNRLEGAGEHRILGSLSELADYVKRNHVDVVYCALPCWHPRIRRLVEELHDTTASVYFVPDVLSFDLIQARVETIAGLPAIALCESPFCGVAGMAKRASDLLLASVALVLLSPLALAISVAIKMTSTGPVLFRQRRYGVDGREIVVYKFRTMTCLDDGSVVKQATRDDPRTTPIGKILRQYSLDEIPQFLNVLQGRMSVIGPRPHAVAHNELYRKLIPGYMIRHKVRPGITGLAQVRGLRGETDTVQMRARVECDLEYLREWSLSLDLWILVRTLGVVLERKNAY